MEVRPHRLQAPRRRPAIAEIGRDAGQVSAREFSWMVGVSFIGLRRPSGCVQGGSESSLSSPGQRKEVEVSY